MLQWPQLTVLLLLCAAVRAKELKCDQVFDEYCTSPETQQKVPCLICDIKNQQISQSDAVIFMNHTADVGVVFFTGGNITKMPSFSQKTKNNEISGVRLSGTNTRVLNAHFFGDAGENLTYFRSEENYNLFVEAFAFQNCKNLEHIDLGENHNSNIAPDAFRELHKLTHLNLGSNNLSLVLNDWFLDLDNLEELGLYENQLAEIPENAFKSLTKLKNMLLMENKIEIITKNMFQHNKQLLKIDLRSNRISQIQSGSFAHLSQLTDLDLRGNQCVSRYFRDEKLEEIAEEITACYPTSACVIPQI